MTAGDGPKRRPTALLTGASSGIGERLARRFARGGFDLLLVARREDRLRDLAGALAQAHGGDHLALAADLADPAAPRALFDRVGAAGRAVDALVNNAGFGVSGPVAEVAERAELDLIRVNVAALVHLTKLFLPAMIARRSGRILNVASIAAFAPGPFMASYYASKAFVVSFSEALAVELQGTGVTVTALCPGATATEFDKVAGTSNTPLFRGRGVMDADEVARVGFDGMMAGRGVVVPGASNRLLVFTSRFAPRRALARIARRLNRPA
jgi:short-subunit dehydrogenase